MMTNTVTRPISCIVLFIIISLSNHFSVILTVDYTSFVQHTIVLGPDP